MVSWSFSVKSSHLTHTATDIQIPKVITISSNDSTIFIPIHVKDDDTAEGMECGILSIALARKYNSLYEIDTNSSRREICIDDNDSKL